MFKGMLCGFVVFVLLILFGCQSHQSNLSEENASQSQGLPTNQYFPQLTKRPSSSGTRVIGESALDFYVDTGDCDSGPFPLKALQVEEVRVSNHDLHTVTRSLDAMGYKVISLNELVQSNVASSISTATYGCEELPVIVTQLSPPKLKVSFSDEPNVVLGQLGHSNAGELDSFLVYFHPQQKERLNKLQWLVENRLDTPSAQVYIETMVLEVREEDSQEFGIAYSKGSGDSLLSLGSLVPGGDTLGFIKDTFTDPETGLQIFTPGIGKRLQLKAMIDEGKAEVLSRPSVLAISNRQAVIQIVDIIQTPELSSTLSENGNVQISAYEFTALPIGITLNLKPRVSANRDWLTLEIDATVESEDDENTGQVFAATQSGEQVLLAEKKGSSSKKVRTFARIPDRTPIIIGGLVSKSLETLEAKVPLLGSIPVIGKLFTSTDEELQKREIIIVLTPFILDESRIGVASNQPSEQVKMRLSDSLLFENRYLLKSDDLFDLSYFTQDQMHQRYQTMIYDLLNRDPSLKSHPELQAYTDHFLPGERYLVYKTLFDIVSASSKSDSIENTQVIIAQQDGKTMTLQSIVDLADNWSSPIIINGQHNSSALQINVSKPEHAQLVNDETYFLRNEKDVTRLKNAILVRQVLLMNQSENPITLSELYPGKFIVFPKITKQQSLNLDKQTLEIFASAESYDRLMMEEVEQAYVTIDKLHQELAYSASTNGLLD